MKMWTENLHTLNVTTVAVNLLVYLQKKQFATALCNCHLQQMLTLGV